MNQAGSADVNPADETVGGADFLRPPVCWIGRQTAEIDEKRYRWFNRHGRYVHLASIPSAD
jgi:hypothetical protein